MPIDFVDSLVADPMGFLASNCVMMAGAVSCPAEAVGNFIIAPYTGQTIIRYRNWGKKTGHYYEIRQYNPGGYRPPDSEDFEAIWSGYAGGHATHCELPVLGKRSVMLTPRLDGCTLTWLQRPDGSEIVLPSMFSTTIDAGDVYVHLTAGGGGWGDPLERDPEAIRNDVLDGQVTEQAAKELYGWQP